MRTASVFGLLALLAAALAGPERGSAQLYQFGKNKVQYDEFDWQKMETAHFDVYFYPEEQQLASWAARMAEEGYRAVEQVSGHTVKRRIPLIVYSSHVYFEQTNIIPGFLPEGVAGFTESLKGRVALPLSGSLPEFERVLVHELVHVFMFDRIRTVLKARGAARYRRGPLWFSEGLAEYWAGPWDSYGDMIIRDALFSQRLVPIAQMHRIQGTFQMYKEGQSICEFMAARHGPDVFVRLLDNWWRSEEFAEVFEITTGEPLADFDEKWGYHLRKTYLPDIEGSDPPGEISRAVTRAGFNLKPESAPGRTAGGEPEVLFFHNHRGHSQIARAPLRGVEAEPQVVVPGTRLPQYESLHELNSSLAVSPDGRLLAFSAKRRGRDHLHLWDLGAGRLAGTLSFEEIVAISSPTWSPEGGRIAFSGAGKGGISDLHVVDVASGGLERLTADLFHDRDPDWHPAGDRLVFSSDRWEEAGRQGYYSLFEYDFATRQVRPLTRGKNNDLHPAWSPDGGRIAFSSDRDGRFDLFELELQGSGAGSLRRLTRVLTGVFDPAWLPDGNGLLYTGFESGGFQIYRHDLATGSEGKAEPGEPIDLAAVAAAADSGWTLEESGGSGAIVKSRYRKHLSLDIAQSQISQDPVFGTSGGIQIALSDILGNDQFYFVLSHISGSDVGFFNGLNLALGRLHLARQLNIAWGVFRLNDRFSSRFGRFVREKRTGAYTEFSYPFSRNNRIVTRLSVRHADIDRSFQGRQLKGWLMSNHVTYTHDGSFWIPTGPLEGTRYSFGAGQSVDFKSSRRFNVTLFGDYRRYLRLSRRGSFAVRYMVRHSRGEVPEYFSLGGSWTLRGYPWRSIWGHNLLLANHELRFPLLDRIVLAFPFGNIDLRAFRGALFADAGNAWSDRFGDWRGSFGGGVRIALGGVFVFRLDASRRTDFKSIGGSNHWDFFFGWDF